MKSNKTAKKGTYRINPPPGAGSVFPIGSLCRITDVLRMDGYYKTRHKLIGRLVIPTGPLTRRAIYAGGGYSGEFIIVPLKYKPDTDSGPFLQLKLPKEVSPVPLPRSRVKDPWAKWDRLLFLNVELELVSLQGEEHGEVDV